MLFFLKAIFRTSLCCKQEKKGNTLFLIVYTLSNYTTEQRYQNIPKGTKLVPIES